MIKTPPLMFIRPLAMLCCLLFMAEGGLAAGSVDENRIGFTVPAAPWTMTLPAAGFTVEQRQQKPDGSAGYFMLFEKLSNLHVSFYIEPVGSCLDSKACRDMVRKLGNPAWEDPKNFVSAEIGNISYFEFLMPSFRGQPLQQQNMYAEFVVDGYWVDLHISKVLYKPEEHKLFEDLVKSVKFEPKPAKDRS